MESPAVWNKSEILSQLSGDEVFLRELLGDLRTLIEETLPALEKSVLNGDYAKAGTLSHTLKGSSGNLAAQEVYQLSRNLEAECKAGGAEATVKFGLLKDACRRLLDELVTQGWLA